MIIKLIGKLAIAVSSAMLLAGASPVLAQDPPKDITVGILTTGAPFTYKEGNDYKGFEVDLINAIAKQENLAVHWSDLKFEAMIPALQADQIDLAAASFFVREERKKVVDFSDSYFKEGNVLAVPVNSPIKSLQDLKNKVIVAKKGAAGMASAEKIAAQYGATIRGLDDEPNMYLEVKTGNADGVVHDSAILGYKIKLDGANPSLRLVGDVIDTADIALAFPKGSKLTAVFNAGIAKLRASGELDRLNDAYFGK